ncbi:MAG: tetratricopeptide repeat protein [Flavitalea sp.]
MDRINKIKEFLEQTPTDSFLQHALALEYIKVENDPDARKLFEEILQRDPTYTGSYYHLGKLLERVGETQNALLCYERGMEECKKLGDQHSYNELQGAYEDLAY